RRRSQAQPFLKTASSAEPQRRTAKSYFAGGFTLPNRAGSRTKPAAVARSVSCKGCAYADLTRCQSGDSTLRDRAWSSVAPTALVTRRRSQLGPELAVTWTFLPMESSMAVQHQDS